jgi:hypothetical protein
MFSFYGNHISMSVLKGLLYHPARLSQELYPAPLESYDGLVSVVMGDLPNIVLSSWIH